jgi:hypothetical protein
MMTPVKLTNYRQGKYEVLNMQLYICVQKEYNEVHVIKNYKIQSYQ